LTINGFYEICKTIKRPDASNKIYPIEQKKKLILNPIFLTINEVRGVEQHAPT